MRRMVVVVGLTVVMLVGADHADAGWQSMRASWQTFWHRVHTDWHRNNAWPEPFTSVDRAAVQQPLAIMVENGWRLQNTISNQLFDSETQELTRAGEMKVRWILTQMPPHRRSLFVLRGETAEITKIRVQSVEKAAATTLGDVNSAMIAVTDTIPQDGSGDYYERVNQGYQNSVPPPRLPSMNSGGSSDGN